uniref:pentapeptide repeat-containing protein n=2 Tax=Yoonia sp. TaxID=2212373 RepID=UPI0040488503
MKSPPKHLHRHLNTELFMIGISAAILIIPAILVALVWKIWRPNWLGFRDKSLWDWIGVLAVPMVVGFATFLLSAAQAKIERDRSSENALQRYFGRVTDLALDERLQNRSEMVAAIGRAETMAILRLVEGERAGRAFAFLAEMNLLNTFAVEFEGLDLTGAELKGLDLAGLDFEASEFRGADFEGADLRNVDFEGAILINADFKEADLRQASFDEANLKGAELDGADMRGANLGTAFGLTNSQIAQACIDKTTVLPLNVLSATTRSGACNDLDPN